MKFTKFTLVALVLALMVCAFAACGGDTPAVTEGEEAPANTEAAPATDAETEPATPAECQHTNVTEQIDEATCEVRGYKRTKCADCGEQISVKPIDMVDHVADKPATCNEGSKCKFCGTVLAEATGHLSVNVTDSKEATPEEPGYQKGTCADCGEEINKVLIFTQALTFDSFEAGALDVAQLTLPGFATTVTGDPSALSIVKDGMDTYLSKSAARAPIYFEDTTGLLNTQKFEIVFDFRLEGATQNSGFVAVNNRVTDTDEMRILSMADAKDGKTSIYFGEPNNSGVYLMTIMADDTKWRNLRIVVDPETVNYEIYLDGEMFAYTTSDSTVPGGHLLWKKSEGNWKSETRDGFETGKQSPFTNDGTGMKGVYFFHYNATPLSIDNIDVHLIAE